MSFAKLNPNSRTPASIEFDDIYFSPTDGVGESQYHFLEGNHLPQRFATHLQQGQTSDFVIAETGFGTGLNFLLTANLWITTQQTANSHPKRCLHYISVEKHPIEYSELQKIYCTQNWENDLTKQFISHYPKTTDSERYTYSFDGKYQSIKLTLLVGDAAQELSNYEFISDAWFLDGFSPNKNPDMWKSELFELMAKRSREGSTFATFTAASFVRKGLQDAGFKVNKTKGFGKKRERLIGHFIGN